MTDIVIPLIEKTRYNFSELRYCLRSIEKHLTGYGKVWIVGYKPSWQNAEHIPATDPHDIPDRNIMEKIKLACLNSEVSDSFLFFNDDHFLLSDYQAEAFPYYHMGTIEEYCKNKPLSNAYATRVRNVQSVFGPGSLMFDIHTPIIYNKKAFLEVVCGQDWGTKAYTIKSLYGNGMGITGEYMTDGKFNELPKPDVKVFSTYPHVKASIFRFLQERFPEKSKFEI